MSISGDIMKRAKPEPQPDDDGEIARMFDFLNFNLFKRQETDYHAPSGGEENKSQNETPFQPPTNGPFSVSESQKPKTNETSTTNNKKR